MPSTGVALFAATAVVLGVLYQVYLSPLLELGGVFRNVEPMNTERCEAVEGLQACEKLVIHSSGLVYLACAASPWSRTIWLPAREAFNATALRAQSSTDYIATYDPRSRSVNKLDVLGLPDARGLNLNGMDVVPDENDSELLWVYLVNHRPPLDPTIDATRVGADSVIEIFKTRLGASTIEWVKTVGDPAIIVTPNDVIGGATGEEFWFTNDHHVKVGLARSLHILFGVKSTSVGYCHVNTGCKIAADELYTSNGILRNSDGNVWVASSGGGYITVHEQQADKTLVPTDVVHIGRSIDNLALSTDGSVIVASFPKVLEFFYRSIKDPSVISAVSAHRISINSGHGSYFGEKYKVEKIFEEDGAMLGSAATTAAIYKDILYLHGVMGHRLLVCKIPPQRKQE